VGGLVKRKKTARVAVSGLSSSGWQKSGHQDSGFGARIRVLGTWILREGWDADCGGFGGILGW